MRTEQDIREQLKAIESVIEMGLKLGIVDSHFSAFHVALNWVLEDPKESISTSEERRSEK